MITTYNKILRIIEAFGEAHNEVKRVLKGEYDQMGVLTANGEAFPCLYITPQFNMYDDFVNEYEIRVHCYDRITKDRLNYNNIMSKTATILSDLDAYLRTSADQPLDLEEASSATPFANTLEDEVAGWYMDIRITAPSYTECAIPFKETPYLDDICYEGSVQPYQTIIIKDLDGHIVKTSVLPYKPIVYITVNCSGETEYIITDEFGNPIVDEFSNKIKYQN